MIYILKGMKDQREDPSMARVHARFKKSGMSLHELGVKMGYPEDTARMSAWQFLSKTDDPRIGMLRKFAKAMGIQVEELVSGSRRRASSEG
jgi:transcriptional regulator with XRE-family HTH domain